MKMPAKSTKNRTYQNLIEAHRWLGISMSVILFLVFWAGSISLFRAHINQWAVLPHAPIDGSAKIMAPQDLIDKALADYKVNTKKPITLILPRDSSPYYRLFFERIKKAPNESARMRLNFNPVTGEAAPSSSQFRLADFIYFLHRDLDLSDFGEYLIGAVTLLFLFALFSGIYIHAKRLIGHFFSYRIQQQRAHLFDLHTVIGVMTIPFTVMYAITGLMFNFSVIYKAVFVTFVYQGDSAAYARDSRAPRFRAGKPAGVKQAMPDIAPWLFEAKRQGKISWLRFYHYGDEAAVVQISGQKEGAFIDRYNLFFKVKEGVKLDNKASATNYFSEGRRVMKTLHFGDFANTSLRLLYFVLGMSVAAMIVAGNLLWAENRRHDKNVSARVTRFFSNMTLGSCGGIIVATAAGFLLERVLPIDWANRANILTTSLVAIFVLVLVSAYRFANKRIFISRLLYLSAALLMMTLLCGWLLLGEAFRFLWQGGIYAVLGVQCALWLSSVISIAIGRRLARKK